MTDLPENLRYAKTHEWARLDDSGLVTVGITDYAQQQLGDLVFVELPQIGLSVASGSACAVVESVKAASDIYAPVEGEVVEINNELSDTPELINEDPYGDGWLMRIRPADATGLEELLDVVAYQRVVVEEG